jgi:hypothetical protein
MGIAKSRSSQPVEAGVDFRQARAAFEDHIDAPVAGEVLEQHGAKIVFLDDLAGEAGLGGGKGNRLAKQRHVLMKRDASVVSVIH